MHLRYSRGLVMEELDRFLDEHVGSDPSLLHDLYRSLTKERDGIEMQLSGTVAVEGGNEWQRVVMEVRETLSELELLKNRCMELCGGSSDDESVGYVNKEVSEYADEIREKTHQLVEVDHLLAYFNRLRRIMELSSRIEIQLSPGGDLSVAVDCHDNLASIANELQSSQSYNLVLYANSSTLLCGQRLNEKIVSDFSAVLSELHWPFSSTTPSTVSQQQSTYDSAIQSFSNLFNLMLKLDPHITPRGNLTQGDQEDNMNCPLIPPLEQLIQPLRKRFRYHFLGERRTNCKEKPEWYFTQLSSWIRDHTHFLEQKVQPLLDIADLSHINALAEFTRGLLQEAEVKLRHDLQDIVQDDVLMSHLIDELLLFTRELTLLGYPPSLPSLLSILLDDVPFRKWLSLEKQFAMDRLEEMMSSPTAWSPVYETVIKTDDTRVPEVGEYVLSLIAGITDRYRALRSVLHQIKFVDIQCELLQVFLSDLRDDGERMASQEGTPLTPQFCAHVNASNYIASVLREWGEMKFFLSLHYDMQDNSRLSSIQRPDIDTILQLRKQDSELVEVEGNIFSSVSTAFRTHCNTLQDKLVQFTVASFRTGCKRYRKEDWSVQEGSESELEVSSSLSFLLPLLQQQLVFLRENLAMTIFPTIFERIANHIDQILYTEVVLPTCFGVGGTNQLNFDLTVGFLPVLSQFCEELLSRQLMERTREACQLLQLLPGSAKLLRELLVGVVRGGVTTPLDTYSAAVTTLNEFGVHTLEPVQAHQILSNMIAPP